MIRLLTAALLTALASAASADMVTTFEDQGLGTNTYNNHPSSGDFQSGGNEFNNSYEYNAQYDFESWYGWATSSKTDGGTDPINLTDPSKYLPYQYSAVPGSGSGGSRTYAVGYTLGPYDGTNPPPNDFSVINLAAGTTPVSIDLTNTTYTEQVIKYGNGFSQAFGNGDYFQLTITGYNGLDGTGVEVGTPVDVYLANFQNSMKFILTTWETVDLTGLAGSRSLRFGLTSTDYTRGFGSNTPTYFAADNFVTAVPEPASVWMGLSGLVLVASARRIRRNHASIRGREGRDA